MSAVETTVLDLLRDFCTALTKSFAVAGSNPAQPEDQLKAPVKELIEGFEPLVGREIVARTEAAKVEGVRPDVGVTVGKLLTGHIELKAPGKGAQPAKFKDPHDKGQAKKLASHPNLVYTDGNEWALYREGTRVSKVVRASGDVRSDGTLAYDASQAVALETLLRDFLGWQPIVPSTPGALARLLAPLTRLLREAVLVALQRPESALSQLADEWRTVLFADADDAQFADSYAQTVTYALLLARVEGEVDLQGHAADRLDRRHGLLAQVLRVLAQKEARDEVDVQVSLLERAIGAVDPVKLQKRGGADLWLYFYEDFLSAYDARLRKQSGVYYTPPEVVEAQVALVAELLREEFDRELGFADEDVVVLDPAVGTGTYLLAAVDSGAEAAAIQGPGAQSERTSLMARNFYGFEILVGPYAVAQLRIAQRVLANGGTVPEEGLQVILTDTLESPYGGNEEKGTVPLFERRLAEENARARRVKAETPVLVCIGNPPYFRQVIDPEDQGLVERLGGWVRKRDDDTPGILGDFLKDAPAISTQALYNLYVYFWRWALWKVFESAGHGGIVSFITPSSYLRGPGFAGMRRHMRALFDELWILDLGGDGRGARQEENVFAILTPVAIAIGYRRGDGSASSPAKVHYARIRGTRAEKLEALRSVRVRDDVTWADCFDGWTQPFLPASEGDYFDWPPLTDLFPWQHSGAQWKRTWPIAPAAATLVERWSALLAAADRASAFRETRDRKIGRRYPPLGGGEPAPPSIDSLPADAPAPPSVRYAYRSFDRQYALADSRLGDFLRPPLWSTLGPRQVYMTSLLTGLLGKGPAATAAAAVPDMHHFRGSFGAKDVIPLWRDALGTRPNITDGLLEALPHEATPEDLLAYCYALLQAPSYTERFAEELELPGPRVPLTEDDALWARTVELGRELLWLHTYGERFVPPGQRAGRVPPGTAKYVTAIPGTPAAYPRAHRYDAETQELRVGDGVFAPIAPEVRGFSVSGLDVVGSWLDYRMRDGAGRKSSPLDDVRPATWPAQFTTELLELLSVIEHTVALQPRLDALLDEIVAAPTIPASALPQPSDEERQAPG
jgi:hypothetical protein